MLLFYRQISHLRPLFWLFRTSRHLARPSRGTALGKGAFLLGLNMSSRFALLQNIEEPSPFSLRKHNFHTTKPYSSPTSNLHTDPPGSF